MQESQIIYSRDWACQRGPGIRIYSSPTPRRTAMALYVTIWASNVTSAPGSTPGKGAEASVCCPTRERASGIFKIPHLSKGPKSPGFWFAPQSRALQFPACRVHSHSQDSPVLRLETESRGRGKGVGKPEESRTNKSREIPAGTQQLLFKPPGFSPAPKRLSVGARTSWDIL